MHKTVVLNVVGLTPTLLGPAMPKLSAWARQGAMARIKPAFPAVTCTAQSDYLTGPVSRTHTASSATDGIRARTARSGSGSSRTASCTAPKIWDAARATDPSFTCANLFWWFNMYSTADYSVTPRPMYPADGRKIPDVYTAPGALRDELQAELGTFPLFEFWGPRAVDPIRPGGSPRPPSASSRSSDPTLTLVYLPHLDYNLQRVGPGRRGVGDDLRADRRGLRRSDPTFYEGARRARHRALGIRHRATSRRRSTSIACCDSTGLIAVREELGLEMLDPGASAAFAVADHQVAHVYVNDQRRRDEVRRTAGVDCRASRRCSDDDGQARPPSPSRARRRPHRRRADPTPGSPTTTGSTMRGRPDFARTVDIHRKPGYDPVELFLDPAIKAPALSVGWKLAKRKAGFRTLLDVIPLDATLVRGSHGRYGEWSDEGPCVISREKSLFRSDQMMSVDVYSLLLRHLGVGV